MPLSAKAQAIADQIDPLNPRMGEVKKLAAKVKMDHELAKELWSTGVYGLRMFAALIMDKAQLSQAVIDGLAEDLGEMDADHRNRVSEWLLANQLLKSAKTKKLVETWVEHPSPTLRRLYWYQQARWRWTGKVPVDNARELLDILQTKMGDEHPDVQWTMNFCVAWIGVHQPEYRDECIKLGERLGLYKGEKLVRGCTPNYLPLFIETEVAKLA